MKIVKGDIEFNVVPNVAKEGEDPWLGGTEAFWTEFQSEREEDTVVLKKYLSSQHSYIDIGSWIGSTTLFASKIAKHCYCFEPDPTAFQFLNRNINANHNSNISAHNIAISNKKCLLKLGAKTGKGDSMSSVLWSDDSWEVPALSIQDVFAEFNIKDCNLIKIDIEGAEFIALPSAKEVLKYFKPTIYLSLHTPWITDKTLYFNSINDVLSIYHNFYDSKGKSITLDELSKTNEFNSIVATM